MKHLVILLVAVMFTSCTSNSNAHEGHQMTEAETSQPKKPLSPRKSAMAMVGSNHVHVDYGSPSKRGRVIFGGLVGFNQVWATGAHKATSISFDNPVIVNGTRIEAGKYGFFTIPGEKEWTLIVNKDWDMHLADDYNAGNDVMRIVVTPEVLDSPVESLTFEVISTSEKNGSVNFSWDTVNVGFEFQNLP